MTGVVTEDGVNIPVYTKAWISERYVKRYGETLVYLETLNGSERAYLDYLTEVMDTENKIVHNNALRDGFRSYMRGSKKKYTDYHLKEIFFNLSHSTFLLPSGIRATYHVNPLYYTRSGTNRVELINMLIEKKLLQLT
jgi:hypothetical protein